jgi:hypothetical protein
MSAELLVCTQLVFRSDFFLTIHWHVPLSALQDHYAPLNIWVILSCTEGWGKDVCLVPGELNEMHRHALSRIWVQLVMWNLQEGVPANIQLVQYIYHLGMEKGRVTPSVRGLTSVSHTNRNLRHKCRRFSIIDQCLSVTPPGICGTFAAEYFSICQLFDIWLTLQWKLRHGCRRFFVRLSHCDCNMHVKN